MVIASEIFSYLNNYGYASQLPTTIFEEIICIFYAFSSFLNIKQLHVFNENKITSSYSWVNTTQKT
jgi:hypothetical protein